MFEELNVLREVDRQIYSGHMSYTFFCSSSLHIYNISHILKPGITIFLLPIPTDKKKGVNANNTPSLRDYRCCLITSKPNLYAETLASAAALL